MEFMAKFKPNELMIKELKHWVVVIRQKQITLGSAVILLKREVESIGGMTSEESAEFKDAIRWYEGRCKELFKPVKFNYYAAMMKDNYVHYHAFPRYSEKELYNNSEWIDDFWPKPITLVSKEVDDDLVNKLVQDFRE